MIGHLVSRARREQRAAVLADFDSFCADQLARVRASGPRHEPEDDPLPQGERFRPMLLPDAFDIEVRA